MTTIVTAWNQIASDTMLVDVDTPFRLRAGPGAGKTHWLVMHIKNVVERSSRLTGASRVACISYTNVAAEEIVERLGSAADRVEVSTIHSFLYRNVVKPYLRLLKNDEGAPLVNYALVDGHDEHRPSYPCIKEWLEGIDQKRMLAKGMKGALKNVQWHLEKRRWIRGEGGGHWQWRLPPMTKRFPPLNAKVEQGVSRYKIPYWKRGIIDHDDVLYFAHRILEEHPELLAFLSSRFPYLFVDEFQDTNPVQTDLVKWLADNGTVVGVVGDPEQAIFGFQGAKREDFEAFSLPAHEDYEIDGNRRSTNRIIALLNYVRQDGLKQQGHRPVEGERVRALVGTMAAITMRVRQFVEQDAPIAVLARKNPRVNYLRRHINSAQATDPWEQMEDCDPDRRRFLEQLVRGVELARGAQYPLAIAEAVKGIRVRDGKLRDPLKYKGQVTILDRQGIALSILEMSLTHYDELVKKPLLYTYEKLGEVLQHEIEGLSLKKAVSGQFRQLAEQMLLGTLAESVTLGEEARLARTIHKAKATEFPNVVVHFESQEQLARVIEPDKVPGVEEEQEERRIAYVGLSRARDRLFVSIENLDDKQETLLVDLGVEVIRCNEPG